MSPKSLTAEDKRWRADSDAETMARYEEIMADAERKRMAINAAKSKASDLNKRATAMTRVAGNASNRSDGGSRTPKPKAKKR